MKKKLLLTLLLCAASAFAKDGFKPLFNGKNLDGWDGDPRLWKAEDGMIVGSTEGNPLKFLGRFIFFGEGDIAPVTREILRQTEDDPKKRPAIHVG